VGDRYVAFSAIVKMFIILRLSLKTRLSLWKVSDHVR